MKKAPKDFSSAQSALFEKIKSLIPSQISVVDTVAELLSVSNDAAYRRIRGEKQLDLDEIITLSRHFGLSLDAAFGLQPANISFFYNPLDLNKVDDYLGYMKGLIANLEMLSQAKDKEIFFSALDVPIFHFMEFKELTLFKIFSWSISVCNLQTDYSSFVEKFKSQELFECYDKVSNNYARIPSTEIWTNNTIDTILRLINFYYDTGYFKDGDTALMLCSQLLDMVDKLQAWAEKGYKTSHPSHPQFNLYLSDIDLENSFMLTRKDNSRTVMIKLFTINSMGTMHPSFCEETEKWVQNIIKRSSLISGASEKERFKFFSGVRQKIRFVIEKIDKKSGMQDEHFFRTLV
jgi:hypothetical protein